MKRLLCIVLSLVMLMSIVPLSASADSSDLGMPSLGAGEEYQDMTTSQSMLDMIKDMEGFRSEPYWDVNQWSIGYGSACGTDPDNKPDITVTEEEAEQMLIELLEEDYGAAVNDYCESIGKQPTQQQFDALVDFTYNLGTGWLSKSYRLNKWLESPTTEMELVNALGAWCRVSGEVSYSTCMRRVREAIVFLWGEYYLCYGGNSFETELTVVSNHDLPYYKLVIFDGNGGVYPDTDKEDTVAYYKVGTTYDEFPTFTRDGYTLSGWQVTSERNSAVEEPYAITTSAVVEENLELTAVWTDDGSNSTEPDETQPDETEPEATEPAPTEPEPTDPPAADDPVVELPFTDVAKDAWYREAVEFVYANGYMNGTSDTSFNPSGSMTRGMLVTVLYRIDGSPAVTDAQRACFQDTQNNYYTDAVAWAKSNGIVNGVSSTKFAPNDKVTRQDAVAIFYRYCVEYLGLLSTSKADISGFADASKVASYAKEPMQWAVGVGLVEGAASSSGLKLNPKGNLTRAEAATLLMRFVEEIMGAI